MIDRLTKKYDVDTSVTAKTALQPGRNKKQLRKTLGQLHYYIKEIGLLQTEETSPKDRLHNIPKEYRKYDKLFAEELETGLPEHSRWDHAIDLIDGTNPTFSKTYPLSPEQLETLKEYITDMLRKGYIRESTSSAGYPVMFVPKKNNKLRLVVDYRRLNEITKKDRTPLPLVEELRDRLTGSKYFTTLDLKSAYNLIRVKEGDEWKTAFRTSMGHFEYLVMPMGLTNAPATFQRMINNVLRQYLDIFVVVYLDDILVFSKTLEEHKHHVHKVLTTLQDAKLLVEPEKTKFHAQEVTFLGHIIRPGEIAMEPKKISAIKDWPIPKDVKQVQGFIGLANYYRRFIQGFSKIAAPMTNATKKDREFQWTPECQQAFDEIKQRVTSAPVLAMFDPDKPTELETDASDFAVAGQIGQRDEQGRLRPVAFFSRKLHGAELNYPIYDKEFMAIVLCFEEFRHYLQGGKHKTKVYTDHKNISYFATTQQLSKRQLRYAETLAEFDFEIIHRKGSENGRADAMSRRPDYDTGQPIIKGQVLRMRDDGIYEQMELGAMVRLPFPKHKRRDPGSTGPTQNSGSSEVPTQDTPGASLPTQNSISVALPKPTSTSSPATTQGRAGSPLPTQKRTSPKEPTPTTKEIPEERRDEFFKKIHEDEFAGHQGNKKTYERAKRYGHYPGMRRDIERRVKNCHECRLAKSARHKPYGELQPLQVPQRPWSSIAFDHITKLPESKIPGSEDSYDSIFVITDRFTKYGYFIPYKEASDATKLAHTFLHVIISQHGLPDEVISDRGTTFTSKFWQAFTALLGVKHKLSTAFHPQTDGQTERLNQTLEQYLRCYVNYDQDNWAELLPAAQFAYNSAYQESTKVSPFFANYGFEPEVNKEPRTGPLAEKAILTVETLQSLHEEMRQQLEFIRQRMAKYYNQGRLKGPTFERGDLVYLLRKNIQTTRPSNKLDYKKLGPFKVEERISTSNYQLSLPSNMKMHPIFHISLLEPAGNDMIVIEPRLDIEVHEESHEVEAIIDKKRVNGEIKYLVKWKGWGDEDNTWEPTRHLKNAQRLLRQYHQSHLEPHSQESPIKTDRRTRRRTSQ